MPLNDHILHPRPQMTRPRWIDLGGPWGFAHDDGGRGLTERWQDRVDIFARTIRVPFPPESPASGIADTSFHPIVWYRTTFTVAPDDARGALLLHCGAVDYRAHVWVNGQLVATHEGGHTPFSADIAPALAPTGEQVLVIRAEDRPTDLAQPRGKQDWWEEPHTIWYHRTTGIWQPVWLEPVSSTHITGVRWTPDIARGVLRLTLTLVRPGGTTTPVRARVQLSLRDTLLVEDVCLVPGGRLEREFALDYVGHEDESSRAILWSPEHPNLIDARLTLWEGDAEVDEVQSYAGLRSVAVADNCFLLNGHPYYLRLVLGQGYWPASHLAAPDEAALRREVELVKELGFNGVRVHQKVEDPRFLYWCDRLGVLVWGEMANAYAFSPEAVERLTREWTEVLARDYSHPCVVAWVPLNESWGVPDLARDPAQQHYVRMLYHLTKALDPTRPAIGNDGWQHIAGDIIGLHDYAFDGGTLRARYGSVETLERTLREVRPHYRHMILPGYRRDAEPTMLTECGGISYRPHAAQAWFGYGTVTGREAFVEKYREIIGAILASPAIAGFCYTQLADTGQETNGLLTDKREHKLDPAVVRFITRGLSAAVPGDVTMTYKEDASSSSSLGTITSGAAPHGTNDVWP